MRTPPPIVLVHNRYVEPGGEDTVFEQEAALLESRGHRVERVEVSNEDVHELGRARLAASLFWSRRGADRVREAVARTGATIAHFHNILPLISPAAYYAARAAGAAVVQTLHNYRLICPGALLMRDGRPCEACVGSALAWKGAIHGCYRGSRTESAGVASMVATHRLLGTWQRRVDAYVALSEFSRGRFIAGGLPGDRLHVRPNFITADPGPGDHRGDFALFAGRLTEQKGVRLLLEAWRSLGTPIPLRIMGAGELGQAELGSPAGVEWLGAQPNTEVTRAMKEARLLLVPSISYENCPMVVLEAFASGLPVIAPRTGSFPALVEDGRTGFLFEPGSADSLADTAAEAWRAPERLRAMGMAARAVYTARYTGESGYETLLGIYSHARRHFEGATGETQEAHA